jgi:hypothetical protein
MIFISYSWTTKPAAYRVLESLLREGVPAWIDDQQLRPGAKLLPSLLKAISDCSVYLYLVSAVANASSWVREELEHALSLEHEGRLRVVPVRLIGEDCELPDVLHGRLLHDLDVSRGGVAKLAAATRAERGAQEKPLTCNVSATVMLATHGLEHTLDKARDFVESGRLSILMLDRDYNSMADAYWRVSEVMFPSLSREDSRRLEAASRIVTNVHAQCRRAISEIARLARAYAEREPSSPYYHYFQGGFERAVRVLLHHLSWNTQYLQALRDGRNLDEEFMAQLELPEPYCGHDCDFVEEEDGSVIKFGTAQVPAHGHPYGKDAPLVPWGLSSPFGDILERTVGETLGHVAGLMFLAETRDSSDLPKPKLLRYGLA